jgi:prepilin-type N-terminal cleavage/methylation domain-containing protein/prepilin-type processing-associated H-X9-DG protein
MILLEMKERLMNTTHGTYRTKAFTLIELLVVIAIIALLLSIVVPSLNKAKLYAQEVVCKSNLHQYSLATQMYLVENDERFPSPWQSLYDSCQGRCQGFCQQQDSHAAFPGEIQRYCRWHNPDYNLQSHPEYGGPYWPYLAATKASICPTFSRVADKYGQFHPNHNDANEQIDVQFAYSMNSVFLRSNNSGYYTARRSQIKNPSQTFLWAEENMWLLEGLSAWVLNDNALHVGSYDSPIDCFGSFHKISNAQLNLQQSDKRYNSGQANVLMVDGSLAMLPPTETVRYKGSVR